MRQRAQGIMAMSALMALAGCMGSVPKLTEEGYLTNPPEDLVSLAAPHQDLSQVKINPDDGCYWYLHDGPVEQTLLPLRAKDGRPICAEDQVLTTAM